VDLGGLAQVAKSSSGTGPQTQLRLVNFRAKDPNGRRDWTSLNKDQLAFWKVRATEQGGEFTGKIYDEVIGSPNLGAVLQDLGVVDKEDGGKLADSAHAR
jgi:hypothetical protein